MEQDKKYANIVHKQLFDELNKYVPLLKDVRDFINPYLGFFDGDEGKEGTRKDNELLRTMNIKYSQILAAGLQWGITSPTRPWVKGEIDNKAIMEIPEVQQWLYSWATITLDVLSRGRFYQENHQAYLEGGVFGNAAMFIEEDDENVINCHTFTCGEYAFGLDSKKRPNSFARILSLSPAQAVEKFGLENLPQNIQNAYKNNNNNPFKIKHLICPNAKYDKTKIDNKSMMYKEFYWVDGEGQGFIRETGYNEFPVIILRWQPVGSEVYATGPGIWSLGDAKQIQLMWRDIDIAAELGVNPAVQAPSDILQSGGINMLPAAINYYSDVGGNGNKITKLYDVNLDLNSAIAVQKEVEECIKAHFNINVFQLLSDMDKGTRTAREVIELSAEKMSQMGPLLERLEMDYLPQIINRVSAICFRRGIYPQPPPELEGRNLKINFTSILSQAQKQYIITPILDTLNNAIVLANGAQKPEILDKINWEQSIDEIASNNGIPPSLIYSDEYVAQVRQARAEQMQQQQAMQEGMSLASASKDLSKADLGSDNALARLIGGGQ